MRDVCLYSELRLSWNCKFCETFNQTIELYIVKLCKQSSLFAKNIIRRKFSWFQIEKIRQKSHRLSVSELAISGFWDLEITNFCSLDIRAKCLICVFCANKIIKFSPKIFVRDICLYSELRLYCNSQSLCSPHTIF